MERPTEAAVETQSRAERPDAAPLRAVELLVVAAVWVFFGFMNVATTVLGPGRDRPLLEALANANRRLFINPVLWALLTALILWMSRRVSLDRDFWRRRGIFLVIAGVLFANVTDLVADALWDRFTPLRY
jgi:hypothetical protein